MLIFVITCDKLEVLKKSIESYYTYIKTPFEIIIVDFGSTHESTVKFLKHLENTGIKVYWKKRINNPSELNNVDEAIQDYFEDHPKSDYVVTDSDIALDRVDGDILEVYSYLLASISGIDVVGSMLRIDDIPDYYPEKQKLITGEKGLHKRFHSEKVNSIQYKDKVVKYIFAPIDTTFGMYKKGKPWKRLMKGVRILSPYSAKHLDWYLDPKNLTPDQKYYVNHASREITHWSIREGKQMKWHPYGNIDPFKIPEIADKLLNEYWSIAEALNIQTFLLYGTCLGFVRGDEYIIGDNDIDVGILGGLEELIVELEKNGFVKKRKLRPCWHFLKYGILLDIYFDFPDRKFLQSFDKVRYKDKYYNVPHPVEDYLKERFGDWKTIRHRKVWEG